MIFAEENDRYLATVRQFLDRITRVTTPEAAGLSR